MPSGSKDQIIGGGTPTDLPSTIGKLPVYSAGGQNAHITDSIFGQGDSGHQIEVGIGAAVNAAQVATKPGIAIGEGALAWGDGTIAIGKNVTAGQNAARDGAIAIGHSITNDGAKNCIRIGSGLPVGGAFSDAISIGTLAASGGQNAVIIGTSAGGQTESVAIGDTASGGEPWAVVIGYHATSPNSGNGTGSKNIVIGYQATGGVSSPGDQAVIAIGRDAVGQGAHCIAIGTGASVSPSSTLNSIAIGHGAVSTTSAEIVIGDTTNGPINKVKIRTAAATALRHLAGASGEWMVQDVGGTNDLFVIDASATAGDIRMKVYDVTAAALKRVTLGVADSGGVGFKLLRVPN